MHGRGRSNVVLISLITAVCGAVLASSLAQGPLDYGGFPNPPGPSVVEERSLGGAIVGATLGGLPFASGGARPPAREGTAAPAPAPAGQGAGGGAASTATVGLATVQSSGFLVRGFGEETARLGPAPQGTTQAGPQAQTQTQADAEPVETGRPTRRPHLGHGHGGGGYGGGGYGGGGYGGGKGGGGHGHGRGDGDDDGGDYGGRGGGTTAAGAPATPAAAGTTTTDPPAHGVT